MNCRAVTWAGQSSSGVYALNYDSTSKTPVCMGWGYWPSFSQVPWAEWGAEKGKDWEVGKYMDGRGLLWSLVTKIPPCFSNPQPPLPLIPHLCVAIKTTVFLLFWNCTWFYVIITSLTPLTLCIWVLTLIYFHILFQEVISSSKPQASSWRCRVV